MTTHAPLVPTQVAAFHKHAVAPLTATASKVRARARGGGGGREARSLWAVVALCGAPRVAWAGGGPARSAASHQCCQPPVVGGGALVLAELEGGDQPR